MQRALRAGLGYHDFDVKAVGTGEDAIREAAAWRPDVILLDLGLPGAMDGFGVLQALRPATRAAVIVVSVMPGEKDKVRALDLGADDYVTKPFHVAELVARCRALIRRANAVSAPSIEFGRLRLETASKEAFAQQRPLELTQREWSILECLVLNAGRIVTKDRLMSAVSDWSDDLTPNAIEVYVSRLRGKLGDAAHIRAVRGLGYRIDECGA